MPLSAPDNLATLTGQRDRLARLGGQATYAGSSDTAWKAQLDAALADALDRLALDLGGSKTFEREAAGFKTMAPRTGTDGVFTIEDETFTSAAATFTTWGIAARDAVHGGAVKAVLRVSTVTSQTALELAQKYASATASAQSYAIARDEFALDNAAWWLRRIWNKQTARPIELTSFEALLALGGDYYRTGEPTHAAVVAPLGTEAATTAKTRLKLWPFPDAAYEIGYTYQAVPTFPTGDWETAPHLQHLLAAAAAAAWLLEDGQNDRAVLFERKYAGMLKAARAQDNQRGDTRIVMGRNRRLLPGGGGGGVPIFRDPRIVDAP